jgi:hypothetical protein
VTIRPEFSEAFPERRLLYWTNFVPEFNSIFFIAPILFCFSDSIFQNAEFVEDFPDKEMAAVLHREH